jgi:hypothetical protein
MKSKWIWSLVLVALGAAMYGGIALASSSTTGVTWTGWQPVVHRLSSRQDRPDDASSQARTGTSGSLSGTGTRSEK